MKKLDAFTEIDTENNYADSHNVDIKNIALLIDSLVSQGDPISRTTADFALCTFIQCLQLTDGQRDDLMLLLEQKFRVTSIKQIDAILGRVHDNLYRLT